jgi:Arylsulfotransferase (ASST)
MTWIRNRPLGLVYRDEAKTSPGYTLFCTVRGNHATLIDAEGRIVHRWFHPEGIQHCHMIENGNLLIQTSPPPDAGGAEKIGGSAGALLELGWDSEVVWEYRDVMMHHAYQRLPSGDTVLVRWEKLPGEYKSQVQGGHDYKEDGEFMWADAIRKIDAKGNTLQEWRSWEHFTFAEDRICPLESRKEWTHGNALDVGPNGDWLISFRLTDTVAIIDPLTGNFRWKWGPGYLSHQHAATFLENGNVLLLDNGCHRRHAPSFSRVVEVNPANNEVVWTYQSTPIVAFYSFMGSGAERLPNGNTFITEATTGRMFEVTPAGETVWEYVSGFMATGAFGPSPVVHRARRIRPDDPRVSSRQFAPERYEELTRQIAGGVVAPAETV